MSFVIWDNEKLKKLTEKEKNLWYDVYQEKISDHKSDLSELKTKEEYFEMLHQVTRTPYFMAYFLWVIDDQIVSLCRVITKENVLYLEGIKTHTDHLRKGYASQLIRQVFVFLKESDFTDVRLSVNPKNECLINLLNKLGFVIYDETIEKIRFRYVLMERPRNIPVFFNRYGLLLLIFGIPYHKDNNERYYNQMISWQKMGWIFSVFFYNLFLVFLLINNNIDSSSMGWVVLSVQVVMWVFTNLCNMIRLFKLRKNNDLEVKQYKKHIKKYTITHTKFMLMVTLIMFLVYVFLI